MVARQADNYVNMFTSEGNGHHKHEAGKAVEWWKSVFIKSCHSSRKPSKGRDKPSSYWYTRSHLTTHSTPFRNSGGEPERLRLTRASKSPS
jgi:hypothetical protein